MGEPSRAAQHFDIAEEDAQPQMWEDIEMEYNQLNGPTANPMDKPYADYEEPEAVHHRAKQISI